MRPSTPESGLQVSGIQFGNGNVDGAWLDAFESLGDNCEFGFVQQRLNNHSSALLRWALLDSAEALEAGIRRGFEGVFAFEHLEPAADGRMVRDVSAGIAFHSAMRAEHRDGALRFVAPEAERRVIHAREMAKIDHLRGKFLAGLAGGGRIYVVKRNAGLSERQAAALSAAIAAHGDGRLLVVAEADERHGPGTVERLDARMLRGRIDRFAPYSQADDVSAGVWETMLRAAAAAFARDAACSALLAACATRRPFPAVFFDDEYYRSAYKDAVPAAARCGPGAYGPGAYEPGAYGPADMDLLRRMFSPGCYAGGAGLAVGDPEALWAHYRTHGLPAGAPPTPLFDPAYYAGQIARLGLPPLGAGETALQHWLHMGLAAAAVPTMAFDEAFYRRSNADLATMAGTTFLHYATDGLGEGRAPTLWFDPDFYRSHGGTGHYDSFLATGVHQGLLPSGLVRDILQTLHDQAAFTAAAHAALLEASAGWQGRIPARSVRLLAALYVPQWHTQAASPLDGFLLFLREGLPGGVMPGPLFDAAVYRRRAARHGLPPFEPGEPALLHWMRCGAAARIVPTERFDETLYRARNPDIDHVEIWGFEHFICHGVHEGRVATAEPRFSRAMAARSTRTGKMPALYHQWHDSDRGGASIGQADAMLAAAELQLKALLRSEGLAAAFAQAQAQDPAVGELASITEYLLPPFHDAQAMPHAALRARLPKTRYDSVICVPWIRVGGADLVACLLARALLRIRPGERVLVLRTDQPHFERANWLPEEADCADMSDLAAAAGPGNAEALLRGLLRGVSATRVFNVNSRLCWSTMRMHGRNLAQTLRLYGYLFCWDLTLSGLRSGYPAEFFAETADSVTAFLTDTRYLKQDLIQMYRLPLPVQDRILPLYTPAQTPVRTPSIARMVQERDAPGSRRMVLWAGRMDRQKRFDLVQEIARLMPDITFHCWGAPLLDAPQDLADLPENIRMRGLYDSFDEVPLADAGAWLFTALWEGMPLTIIELATRGVAIVASAVGGVPELIQEDTGWPVPADADAAAYAGRLAEALGAPAEATRRAEALQRCVADRYAPAVYDAALAKLLAAEADL